MKTFALFSYGVDFPYGLGAVNYIYGPDGTWKPLTDVEYRWNYYPQYATTTHPFNKDALINSDSVRQTTTRDANGHLLLDFDHDGEIDVHSGGYAFVEHNGREYTSKEHNGRRVDKPARNKPFHNFWFDDNWLARYMAQAYSRSEPSGLSKYSDFTRWQIIGGDTSNWLPYDTTFYDTLALDGLYYLASGDSATAFKKWQTMLSMSSSVYENSSQRYTYPKITENYHLGLFKILTNKLILSGDFNGSTLMQLFQHSLSLRSHIISNQKKSGSNLYGWTSGINQHGTLENTESIASNVLALGSGGYASYEAGQSPLNMNNNNYFMRPYNVLSAVTSLSTAGYMTFGPYHKFANSNYTVDYFLRAPNPAGTMAHLSVYDASSGFILAQTEATASQFASNNQWTRISLPVSVSSASNSLEFRTWWYGTANMDIAYISLR